ncbi:NADH dehydrogenase subunit N [Geothermobacter ehrlichii]|uniref:NADH-quinone oxidoreductase subunit N n=1 Tax=Geothermobacter ehrlichii TaxID=213224 RepID=A0A5D3WM48_9BACT|nr:NADH-quinone oxidoreductase subunit N [Geothermobacter ehrlichii]TYO99273.1 NADH dehydrogenase subunit N [Geothermobacter ehrlichii]
MSGAELLALLPVLILALGATGLLMVGAWWPRRQPLLLSGVVLALLAALVAGAVPPPVPEISGMFGAGPYARFFTILWSLLAALVLMLSDRYGDARRFPAGEYPTLVLFAAAGMALLSAATSLVGLLIGLESFTLVLYILIAIDKTSARGTEAGLKYLIMGIVATGFLGFGIALIYAATGSFHFPEIHAALVRQDGSAALSLLGWAMLLTAIGFKVSLVPFHLWTPDVYQGAPAPVTALLSTGSKGAVFAALVGLLFGIGDNLASLIPVLWALAAASLVVGTFCALRQDNIKRMLAYSSITHMGYTLTALLAWGETGREAVIFYLVVYTAANIGAFGVLTAFAIQGEEPQNYRDLRGLGYHHPRRSSALAFFLLSLAGIPPTAGFIAKFNVFHAALQAGYTGLALLGILASLVSLYYYLRPVIVMFLARERDLCLSPGSSGEHAVVVVCLFLALLLGIYPTPLYALIGLILP